MNIAETIAAEKAASDAQIVAKVMGRPVNRGQLSEAFNRVANPTNWKLPIDATLGCTPLELAMIVESVRFFAGCTATAVYIAPARNAPRARLCYRITAPGYYAAVGA